MKGYWISVYEKTAENEIQKKYAEKATIAILKRPILFGKFYLPMSKN